MEHKKTDLKGQDVFVPGFARMSMNERNKVNNYADRYQESDDNAPWWLLIVPFLLLVGMGGAVQTDGNIIFVAILVVTLSVIGAFCFGGLAYGIYDINRKPPLPKAELVRMDDIRWRTLLTAFGDDQALWERMLEYISANRYWTPNNMNDVTREIEPIVSIFLTNSYPTTEGARRVRESVERIFAELDQRVAENDAVRKAEAEVAAAETKRLFDLEVQMAQGDISRYTLSSPFAGL